MPYKLTINGKAQTVDVEADMPLLWLLRDVLDMKGTKFGCGAAFCGACTVHLDGTPVRACQTPVGKVGDKAITTVEGVGDSEIGRRVQSAWMEVDVMQCGYCQAGQIMAATALLKRTPKPTDAQIDQAMNGNLCRCATYNRIRAAIKKAAGIATVAEA